MLLSSCHQATQVFVLCAITYSTCVHFLDKVCVMNIKGAFSGFIIITETVCVDYCISRANDPFATSYIQNNRTELTAGFKFTIHNGGSSHIPKQSHVLKCTLQPLFRNSAKISFTLHWT